MKNKIYLLCLAVASVVMSCSPNQKAEERKIAESPTMTAVMVNDDCFDRKMEAWFSKFNQLQDEGYGMDEANEKAVATVAEEFKDCDLQNKRMATQDSLDE